MCNKHVSECSIAGATLPHLLTQKRLSQHARIGQIWMHAQIQGTHHSPVANMCKNGLMTLTKAAFVRLMPFATGRNSMCEYVLASVALSQHIINKFRQGSSNPHGSHTSSDPIVTVLYQGYQGLALSLAHR